MSYCIDQWRDDVCMPMNVLPRSIERGSVTLFSAGVVLIFLRLRVRRPSVFIRTTR